MALAFRERPGIRGCRRMACPEDRLYCGMLNSGAAMTYDEFAAAGGVY